MTKTFYITICDNFIWEIDGKDLARYILEFLCENAWDDPDRYPSMDIVNAKIAGENIIDLHEQDYSELRYILENLIHSRFNSTEDRV